MSLKKVYNFEPHKELLVSFASHRYFCWQVKADLQKLCARKKKSIPLSLAIAQISLNQSDLMKHV